MSDPFEEIAQLTMPDWDSYGALPITPEVVATARIFYGMLPESLRTADIAPGGDGSIGFEWRRDGELRAFLDILPGPQIGGFRSDAGVTSDRLRVNDPAAAAHWALRAAA